MLIKLPHLPRSIDVECDDREVREVEEERGGIKLDKKTCYCWTCDEFFSNFGIARHRAMHRDRKENCTITYGGCGTITHQFSGEKERGFGDCKGD
ncbi:MAG: hypothetical protein SOZ40_05575 [Ezakiella sp.]|nr:hypothetical protein [Ezakiella sp.]